MPRDLIIFTHNGHVRIGDGHKTFIIAEIGQNHQGDFEIAKKLIKAAKDSGADCAKIQKSSLKHKFTQTALDRVYESKHSWAHTYGEHKAYLEFTDEQVIDLNEYARSIDIIFTASAMDEVSLDLMPKFNAPFIKIGSGDVNNFPLLKKAARMDIPLFLSTGMQTYKTVKTAVEIISAFHNDFVLMHCVSAYPVPDEDINMNLIHFYRKQFPDIHFGYSGHERGSVAHLAVAAGCKVIERHLTLNKTWKGNDHCCSLEPGEFAEMVNDVRHVELIMGRPSKDVLPCEIQCREKLGKSLVAARRLKRGDVLMDQDVAVKVSHPNGIGAERFEQIVGMQVLRDYQEDEVLELDTLMKPKDSETKLL